MLDDDTDQSEDDEYVEEGMSVLNELLRKERGGLRKKEKRALERAVIDMSVLQSENSQLKVMNQEASEFKYRYQKL